MKKISRNTFLKQTLGASALTMVSPYDLFASIDRNPAVGFSSSDELYNQLVSANDSSVKEIKHSLSADIEFLRRDLGYDFAILSASYNEPKSQFHLDDELTQIMNKIIEFLLEVQWPDGTLDFGNLGSPPDTAFILEPLCAGTSILLKNDKSELRELKAKTKEFITKSGDALSVGGVHTPNHRWVVSAALARINALYPDEKYTKRIEDWLGEGVFIDSDGHYQERSRNYSEVINRAFITMSRHLEMPELLEPVRKNLEMTYYYLEPNGDLVTVDSRRQDQFSSKDILDYYHHYRYLAIKDNNGEFAAITKYIENLVGFEDRILNHSLFYFMEEPLLRQELPKLDPPPIHYEKFFETTDLARIRHDDTTATIFGGVDWPLIIASGRSTSPNFFSYRKGEAILKYMRMSANFFSTGYFRSEGLRKEGDNYILSKKIEVPYYQPLPEEKRRADGDYELSRSIDGRFWNKMDFEDRPLSNVKTLEYVVTVKNNDGKVDLLFEVGGTDDVNVTIELCFKEGGELSGVTKAKDQTDNSFLQKGMGEYRYGKDIIVFGPGIVEHERVNNLDGEMYTSHFGSLRTEGEHVYLTGKTPFSHKITLQ
ncbi:hypothetical protein LB465_09215 [Salegentibacter sp. LM13S]|uniref:hypothetical protein n=1 Tax=Salegentibacter lacus TaxID=2873599 RepID=UPI001CCC5BAA|nr:hypothetical protein [Salegentibacter lacus]MBZ9630958.1 hypothetical protein [Salegentibacter lacus]